MAHRFEQLSEQVARKYNEPGTGLMAKKRLTWRNGSNIPPDNIPNIRSAFGFSKNNRASKKTETQNVVITQAYEFNIGHLLELSDEESIRYVVQLIITLVPQYKAELRNAVNREDREDFLAKSHQLRGSISAIQVPAILILTSAAEGIVKASKSWKSLLPILEEIHTIYFALYPKISEEVERQIKKIDNDKLIAA